MSAEAAEAIQTAAGRWRFNVPAVVVAAVISAFGGYYGHSAAGDSVAAAQQNTAAIERLTTKLDGVADGMRDLRTAVQLLQHDVGAPGSPGPCR